MKKLRFLMGFPRGFPKGAPIGLWLPVGKKLVAVVVGDRYIQSDYCGEDYFGTDYR